MVLSEELQFLKEHPKLAGAALGVTGSVILAPVVVVVILNAAGFASGGVVAGKRVFCSSREIQC